MSEDVIAELTIRTLFDLLFNGIEKEKAEKLMKCLLKVIKNANEEQLKSIMTKDVIISWSDDEDLKDGIYENGDFVLIEIKNCVGR